MQKVKVSLKGQLVIPQELREEFNIEAGTEVFLEKIEEGII
jgi:AbrB family looped-hinge helix DNA binding protein